MAACDKVLNTTELLEHIITFLPPRQILKVGRVCKSWKALIDDSTQITHARRLKPKALLPAWRNQRELAEPLYDVGAHIRIHPGLNPLSLGRDPYWPTGADESLPMKCLSFGVSGTREERAEANEPGAHEYLTSPPVQALYIKIMYWGMWHEIHGDYMLLENINGLRGRDLQDLDAKITMQTQGYHVWRKIEGWFDEALEE